MRVLAFDPGPHVGIASWTSSEVSPDEEFFHAFAGVPEDIWSFADDWMTQADVVVCEDFAILGSRERSSNETIEMIGVLRYLARKHGLPFVTQQPADAKRFATNEKLKRIGWYRPSSTDHARSATRHLLLYLVNARHIDVSRVL